MYQFTGNGILIYYSIVWISILFLSSCTVHVDSIKSFICPANAHKLL